MSEITNSLDSDHDDEWWNKVWKSAQKRARSRSGLGVTKSYILRDVSGRKQSEEMMAHDGFFCYRCASSLNTLSNENMKDRLRHLLSTRILAYPNDPSIIRSDCDDPRNFTGMPKQYCAKPYCYELRADDYEESIMDSLPAINGDMNINQTKRASSSDFVDRLSSDVVKQVFDYVDFRTKVKLEGVATHWQNAIKETYTSNMKEVWIYTIFRKDPRTDHEEMRVKLSYHGPIFWERQVVYIYLCTCHFDQHETEFKSLCKKVGPQVDRVCLVDSPVNYPYLTDEFYRFILDSMPNLKWLYLREMDLEPISWSLVQTIAQHPSLKKIVVHWCRNYKTLADFEILRSRLLICSNEIKGMKYIDDVDKQLQDMRIQDAKDEAERATRRKGKRSSMINGFDGPYSVVIGSIKPPQRRHRSIDSGIGMNNNNNRKIISYSNERMEHNGIIGPTS